MAHFAELDDNNIVKQVIVVSDSDCADRNGAESEEIGVGFLKKEFGFDTIWKQTSYNNNIRVRYAGPGYSYDPDLDVFLLPKPYPSWVLNENTYAWEAPIGPRPIPTAEEIGDNLPVSVIYDWDEDLYQSDNTKGWVLKYLQIQ